MVRRFTALPRPQRLLPQKRHQGQAPGAGSLFPTTRNTAAATITRFYLSRHCAVRALSLQPGRWRQLFCDRRAPS